MLFRLALLHPAPFLAGGKFLNHFLRIIKSPDLWSTITIVATFLTSFTNSYLKEENILALAHLIANSPLK